MKNELNDIINALLRVDATGQPQSTPDGVADYSNVARILGALTQDGRAFKSDEPAAMQRALGECLKKATEDCENVSLTDVCLALSMMPTMIVRAVQKIAPTICPEEIYMVAFDQCRIDNLARDLAATPYHLEKDGRISPDVHSHPLLSAPFVIDDHVKHSFMRRHITPAHYAAHAEPATEPLEFEIIDESELTGSTTPETPTSRKVNRGGLGRLTACPLDGFDEFHDYFFQHDHIYWEAGLDFDELPEFGQERDSDL